MHFNAEYAANFHSSLPVPDAMFSRTCLPHRPTLSRLARVAMIPRVQNTARMACVPYTTSVPRARREQAYVTDGS